MTKQPNPSISGTTKAEKRMAERLFDLVRYCRHQLHDEGLITDAEFAALVEVGSASARRLETYDQLRTQNERLRGLLQEVLNSGVEFDDERIGYKVMQLDKRTLDDIFAALAEEVKGE